MEIASSGSDSQQLLDLLTDVDDLSESARAIKEGAKKKIVPKFCATRWTARLTTLSAIIGTCSLGDISKNNQKPQKM